MFACTRANAMCKRPFNPNVYVTVIVTLTVTWPNFVVPCCMRIWHVYVPGVAGAVNVVLNASFAFCAVEAAVMLVTPKLLEPMETRL